MAFSNASIQDYEDALHEAEGWADYGNSGESRAYWQGMRDTLRVVLGITQDASHVTVTGPGADVAALVILGHKR